mmetsp:Transcript_9414/g.19472  ORF Transcript_9414/g.19472 Transcript_9414/m.19472 type:complete len:215 (-) Transcript_9414:569-1213(-)
MRAERSPWYALVTRLMASAALGEEFLSGCTSMLSLRNDALTSAGIGFRSSRSTSRWESQASTRSTSQVARWARATSAASGPLRVMSAATPACCRKRCSCMREHLDKSAGGSSRLNPRHSWSFCARTTRSTRSAGVIGRAAGADVGREDGGGGAPLLSRGCTATWSPSRSTAGSLSPSRSWRTAWPSRVHSTMLASAWASTPLSPLIRTFSCPTV